MTPEEKAEAKAKLKQDLVQLKCDTLDYWVGLIREGEQLRKASGYSQGCEDMMQKLLKAYQKKHDVLMRSFDRGDFD